MPKVESLSLKQEWRGKTTQIHAKEGVPKGESTQLHEKGGGFLNSKGYALGGEMQKGGELQHSKREERQAL